jgi:dephospho-CoA kinase
MLKIGLTGGIGCGKSAVSDIFAGFDIPVIDADIIAHDLVNSNPDVLREITDAFGQDILSLDGTLNRKKLAKIVFNQKKNKQQLEQILHPKVQVEASRQLHQLETAKQPPAYVILTVPLLIEANYQSFIDRILVVVADEETRIQRVQERDRRSLIDIRSIINNQISDEQRLKSADDVIENNSDFKILALQVKAMHKKYMALSTTK